LPVYAQLYVPNGSLWLRQNSVGTWAFLGKWVVIGIGVEVALDNAF
jgi:hypothetical protein